MGALKQYIELYDSNRATIDAGSAGVINAMRPAARESLQGKELPDSHCEGFAKTSIDEMFAPDYGINIGRVTLPCDVASAFKCGVPNVSSLLSLVVNDRYVATSTLQNNLPAGVTIMSLSKAATELPQIVEKYYGKIADLNLPGVALNTLLVQDGVFIHVAPGLKLDKPLQVVALTSVPTPMLSFRRILVVAGQGSSFSILTCDHTLSRENQALTSQVNEIVLEQDAHVDICDLEETSAQQHRYCQTFIRQEDNSDLSAGSMTLTNGTTRNEYRIEITGQHCVTQLGGMAIGSGEQHIDNNSDVIHLAPRSSSRQLFKYVLDDASRGAFEGSIEVTPAAPFTEAYQTDRNILASPNARMHAKPQLLIYNDEVKCSHGATTGQLDERALFYMRSRGIPVEEARFLLMQAFLTEVVDNVRVEAVRDRLRHLVERRLAGFDANCGDCSASCK